MRIHIYGTTYIKTAILKGLNVKILLKPCKQSIWFNSVIRHKLHCIHNDTLLGANILNITVHNKVKLDQAETELQQLMVKEKDNYEMQLIYYYSHSNNHKIFHYISTLKGHANLPTEMCYGKHVANDKQNYLMNTFFSVLKDQNSRFTCPHNNNIQSLDDIEISTTEVYEILSILDVTKAPGISTAVLRHCASSLLMPICHLFKSSISTGRILSQWCTHCIIPIHKCSDKTLVTNYRPISFLCTLSKVLERIIYNCIMNFAMNSFTPHQFGFLLKRSALQQLILLLRNYEMAKMKLMSFTHLILSRIMLYCLNCMLWAFLVNFGSDLKHT